jgi:hypothetical protein
VVNITRLAVLPFLGFASVYCGCMQPPQSKDDPATASSGTDRTALPIDDPLLVTVHPQSLRENSDTLLWNKKNDKLKNYW